MLRATACAAALCCVVSMVRADEPKLPDGATCAEVRATIAALGTKGARVAAVKLGWTPAQIQEARKCQK